MLRECTACRIEASSLLFPMECPRCGLAWPTEPTPAKPKKRLIASGHRPGTSAVIDGKRVEFSAREIDAALDALDLACEKGIHPEHGRRVDAYGEKCGACGQRVQL
jgi:hypothetical protein